MTKKVVKFLIFAYQGISASLVGSCRFRPTCSQYSLEAIERFGIFKGTILSVKRILSCHPFSKRSYYDPV
ncbi:MAG: Alpha-hemolysin [uncultured bacterium]|uniref:Membrane protein insertion efficiency factor YidD n=1 Tax=Candidatus Curtissbacteria bacterium RIFOXYA1_FULL_41_14 TaxID=1797737 RepID=A0A1F5HA96_9BACT|nr:MAG: Alpha-hemolysin [uncultured bacterium]OGD78226.1 MAG: membrane protein insertion efficiency factor YidD [Candidatus Curtissbacteria bacterium RIFCSPHIGHO2_01_FULL_34_40]OGD92090.1 MAG: membrane protein insertion efficiency factor YidD [Candidatus Curtissbacteria bacterium RIFCSPHIGHO2_12_FULL_41_13]OGD95980.1 MAG: membrane protein insertion efficiency factor YidD [Candidatus Curtissbacteria bacterium RIFCSPLOWO2_01_FULL_41_28]OGE01000.1 MAG: membrane protein insertion efficiency factor 